MPRINSSNLALYQCLQLSIFCAFSLSGCVFETNSPSPLDWTVAEFLAIYTILSIVTIFVAFLLWSSLRFPYRSKKSIHKMSLDPYEVAYLSSPEQAVDGIIISLLEQKFIEIDAADHNIYIKEMPPASAHPLELAIAQKIQASEFSNTLSAIRGFGLKATQDIHQNLEQMQLLISDRQAAIAKAYPLVLIRSVLLLGIIRLILVGIPGDSIGFLLVIFLVLFIVYTMLSHMVFHRSIYGEKVLRHLDRSFQADRLQKRDIKIVTIYTFLGAMALRDPVFNEYKILITPPPSNNYGWEDY
jgi:uncharacterized protein (TIGR04222 family)